MKSISVSDFENVLKKAVDALKKDTDKITLERLEYELTAAYLHVDVGNMHPMLFEVNIVRRYTFVMDMISKELFEYETTSI